MKRPIAVVFDIGNVLYDWDPRILYRRLIDDDEALDVFLRDICSREWHFQHDAGRPFAETSAELSARFPKHAHLIAAWGPRFSEQIPGPVAGMPELVAELDEAGVALFAITNFSDEFFAPFRAQEAALFDRFRDIVVSGAERLVKPHAPIYRLALERFGLAPEQALFVDDRQDNVDGAAAIGMHAVTFSDAATLRADLARFGVLA
ncbi:HAD family hydrolase [Sphingomonas radiodurans]|uniref:HAD family hydrolase n=1 Tax=Sphingomonas radiodurans TaxID=2890321 RepID=UPI001E39C4FD|nr:HAD family phosphatase [Sphingomonas radiodurans]WBH17357.1 HAD family phosphatase [Sphingomonas radiodurans]